MEIPGKITALYVLAICFALALFVAVLFDLLRSPLSRFEPVAGNTSQLKGNWFPPRTFDLLTGEAKAIEGIDSGQNPFVSPAWAARERALEPPLAAPEPEPEPPAPPPATKEISLVYRGFYRASSGQAFVYLEVDGTMQVYAIKETLASGWTIAEADATQLTLRAGEGQRLQFPFNRKKSLEVPIPPQP